MTLQMSCDTVSQALLHPSVATSTVMIRSGAWKQTAAFALTELNPCLSCPVTSGLDPRTPGGTGLP
jgi:hypothetical protein